MSSIKSDNFDELCRLCASYDAIKMDIFGDRGRERKLLEKIHTCLPFHVSEEDALPKSLCYRCIYNLENFYDFRKGCVEAVSRLENFVSETDTGNNKVTAQYDATSDDDNHSVISVRSDYSESQEPNPADFLEARMDNEPMQTSRNENHVTEQVIEVNAGSFACPACPKSFSNMSALILHSKLHMAGGSVSVTTDKKEHRMFPCPVCEKSFLSKGNLSNHVKTHSFEPNTINRQPKESNAVRPFQCELCNKTYVVAKHLWGHVSTSHRGDPRVTCPYCSRTFSTPANLEEHKRSKHMHEMKEYFQDAEDNSVTMADSVSVDNESQDSREATGKSEEFCGSRRKNTKPRKIARDLSNDADNTYTLADLEDESAANDISNRSCLLCAKTFSNRSGLRRHLYNVHGLDPSEVEAQSTGIQHVLIKNEMEESEMAESLVEAETVFCCEVCVREFNDRASLWLHMLYSHREEASTACGICLRVCSDNVSLSEHIHSCHPKDSLGTEKRRYSCQVCARQHDSRKKLIAHVKIHNLLDEEGHTLDPESMVVLNNDFYGHDQSLRNTMDDEYSLSCEICYKSFPTETKLMKHKRNAHKDSQKLHSLNSSNTYHSYFSCEMCGLSHATRTERWKHVFRCHSDEPSLVCELEQCKKVFPTRALKIDHSATHHQQQGEMPNTCEICGNIWATRINYWKHMMGVHRDSLPFICGVCLKIFVSIPDLASHVQERHKTTESTDYSCDICGRPYTKKSKMSRHRKIHNIPFSEGGLQEGQFESQAKGGRGDDSLVQLRCDECPTEEFIDLEELSEHRRSAHNLVPCDLCPKYYGRTSHLWKHVNKIHKGHKDITCSICLRTSASKVHLIKHFAKHHRALSADIAHLNSDTGNSTEESVHTCTKCSKVFRKDHLMQQHLKHCTGPRTPVNITSSLTANGTFQCDKCNKVCDTRKSLHNHIKSSHIMYPCELCEDESKNELFDSKTKLFEHIVKVHHNHPDLTCDVPNCFKMLRLKKDLLKHRREHRQGYPTPACDFCGELITNRIKLRKHLKTNHSQHSKWVCYVCAGVEQSYESLGVHIKENHPMLVGKPNVCTICAKRCPTKHKLIAHVKIHGDEFSFCEKCLIVFRDKDEYIEHRKNHNNDKEGEVDSKLDSSELGEGKVKREHSDDEDESNKRCKYDDFENNEFKPCVMIPNKSILESSLNSSTYSNPYSTAGISKVRKVYEGDDEDCICELCGRIWASKKQLWQHLFRSHSTDAATACGVCLKICNNYINLDMHLINKHPDNFEGEGNHLNCRICGKFHPSYAKLLTHITIHVGEEKRASDLVFACSVCKISFTTQAALGQHNIDKHSDMIFPEEDGDEEEEEEEEENLEEKPLHHCEVCDEEFDGLDMFLEHSRKHRLQNDEDSEMSLNNSRTRISEEDSTNLTADGSPKSFSETEDQDMDHETEQMDYDENLTNSTTCKDSEDNTENIFSDMNKDSVSSSPVGVRRTEDVNGGILNLGQVRNKNTQNKEENKNSGNRQFVLCDELSHVDSNNGDDNKQMSTSSEQNVSELVDGLQNQATELNLMEV